MKRRGFLKFLGIAAVAPVAIAKAIEPESFNDFTKRILLPQLEDNANNIDWGNAPMYILTENANPLSSLWPAWDKEAAQRFFSEAVRKSNGVTRFYWEYES